MSKTVTAIGFTEDMMEVSQIFTRGGTSHKAVQGEAHDIVESMQHSLLQIHQRKTIDGSLGRWFCLKKERAAFFALTETGYPDRLAYLLLNVC